MRVNSVRAERCSGVDVLAKALGLVLFVGGILLLAASFRLAYEMFSELSDASHVWVQTQTNPETEPSGAEIGSAMAKVGIRILLLFAMGFLASLIASKGTQLYAAAAVFPRSSLPPPSPMKEE